MNPHQSPDSFDTASLDSSLLYDAVELISASGCIAGCNRATESADGAPAPSPGWVWEAEMLKPGLSLNGNTYYTPQFIRDSAREFEGCPSYADHQSTPAGSIRNVVGRFQNVRASEQFGAPVPSPAVIPSASEGSALSSVPYNLSPVTPSGPGIPSPAGANRE